MASKTRQSLAQPDLQFGNESSIAPSAREKLNRLTQSVRAVVAELQKLQQAMAGGSTGEVLEKTGAGDYEAAWGTAPGGTITGAENLGEGVGIFKDVEAGLIALRSLIAGANVTLVPSADAISIVVETGGDSGIGTVTSVGIDSGDLDVTGTPITSHGSITLSIKAHAVTYPKMQDTTQDAVVLGRRVGEGPGQIEELTAVDLTAMGIGGGNGYPPQLGYAGL